MLTQEVNAQVRDGGRPERSGAERSEASRSGGLAPSAPSTPGLEVGPPATSTRPAAARPDPEVSPKPRRRTYRVAYKLRILKEIDACTQSGQIGAIVRREGLYSSAPTRWRRERQKGILVGLSPRKRGPKVNPADAQLTQENQQLRRDNQRLQRRLQQAEVIIDVQKKISKILDIPLKSPADEGSDS